LVNKNFPLGVRTRNCSFGWNTYLGMWMIALVAWRGTSFGMWRAVQLLPQCWR
jgi:hypothetical protein